MVVNPLRVPPDVENELHGSLTLFGRNEGLVGNFRFDQAGAPGQQAAMDAPKEIDARRWPLARSCSSRAT